MTSKPDQSPAATSKKIDRLIRSLRVLERATRTEYVNKRTGKTEVMPSRITLDTVRALLYVGSNPMASVREIGDALEQPSSTISRQLLDLGIKDRHRNEGFGLVDPVPDAVDMRIKRYRLTPKGRTLVDAMIEELK